MSEFIHPYNFVRLPDGGIPDALKKHPLFRRHAAETHDRFVENKHSGYLECELTTHTDWFIPSADKVGLFQAKIKKIKVAHPEHKTLGFFSLDPVRQPWFPPVDQTKPAIPGSSLRGMIRNVFETATLSCFGEFDSRLLDFRFPKVLDQFKTKDLSRTAKGVPLFAPVRLRKLNGEHYAELLVGKHQKDHVTSFPYANAVCYVDKVRVTRTRAGSNTPLLDLIDDLQIKSCDPIAVVVRAECQSRQKRNTKLWYRNVGGKGVDRQSGQNVHDIFAKAVDFEQLKPENDQIIVFGYWYRTGPNFMSKHDERVFFSWSANHNFPVDQFPTPKSCLNDDRTLLERYEDFVIRQTNTDNLIYLPAEVISTFESSIVEYNGRNKNASNDTPRAIDNNAPHPSDFIDKNGSHEQVKDGDLFYALIENLIGSLRIDSIYPVAVPRLRHPEPRGKLLWNNTRGFYPCRKFQEECEDCQRTESPNSKKKGTVKICPACKERHLSLCPACRVFGWVREFDRYEAAQGESDRIDSVAGHVHFSHGELKSLPTNGRTKAELITLPILDTPKPTFTDFYLRKKEKATYTSEVEKRWPPAIQKHPSPLYRTNEANLRGRKLYRRKSETKFDSNDPKVGGLISPPDNEHHQGGYPGNQNQTVHAQPKNMVFKFRVDFDNLSDQELGALVFSLNLELPKELMRENTQLRHMLGHGKSLGMGQSSIKIVGSNVKSHDQRTASYKSFDGLKSTRNDLGKKSLERCSEKFFEAWSSTGTEVQECWNDLINMLSVVDINDCPVHFPTRVVRQKGRPPTFDVHENDHYEIFGWYGGYRQQKNRIPLPDPVGETEGTQPRLSTDPCKRLDQ